jgi:bifunctional DNA-binding transcriptional regulator/antitoxin component of YhaV-PrlF toxin-antitoxin module
LPDGNYFLNWNLVIKWGETSEGAAMPEAIFVNATVSAGGKINLPAKVRRALGVEAGGRVQFCINQNEVSLKSRRAELLELQARTSKRLAGLTVDQFLTERRDEALHDGDIDPAASR